MARLPTKPCKSIRLGGQPVREKADAIWAHIEWRRRDPEPEKKNILIYEAATGRRIENIYAVTINRLAADIVLQAERSGKYFAYFLPYRIERKRVDAGRLGNRKSATKVGPGRRTQPVFLQ